MESLVLFTLSDTFYSISLRRTILAKIGKGFKCRPLTKIFKLKTIIFSGREVFCKRGVLQSFTNFIRKHLCWSLYFIIVAGMRSASFKNIFLKENFQWLLLSFESKTKYRMKHSKESCIA